MSRRLCIALHDVAPATWPRCARLLELLDSLGAPPLTLLVVPDWHARGCVEDAPDFRRAIDRRRALGDEVALHGYFHRDDAPAPRTPPAWVRRRVLTAGEGEFADLSCAVAAARIRSGLDMFARLGWAVEGFVPPAWLASAGTRVALQGAGVRWTSTHRALVVLGAAASGRQSIVAPCLTASPRSTWRRYASRAWLRAALEFTTCSPLLRVGLHPGDADHRDLVVCWRALLTRLLQQREALTKSRAIAAILCAGGKRDAATNGGALR